MRKAVLDFKENSTYEPCEHISLKGVVALDNDKAAQERAPEYWVRIPIFCRPCQAQVVVEIAVGK